MTSTRVVRMRPEDPARGDMVFVTGGNLIHMVTGGDITRKYFLSDYFIDRFSVTNADFKEFVDVGGYLDDELWKSIEFARGDVALDPQSAIPSFVDATGRPGPAGWRFGNYPEGEDDYPVTGVSWYEAAAFARFRGGELPTAAHWNRAAREYQEILSAFSGAVVEQSNFSSKLAPVRESTAIGAFGVRDIAGNAREWASNPMHDGRATLGGSHDDPGYMFVYNVAVDPWTRDAKTGFRTIKRLGEDDAWLARRIRTWGTPRDLEPVGDDVFDILATQFSYVPSTPRVNATELNGPSDRRRYERIVLTYPDGTGLTVHVQHPRGVAGRLQPLVCFPGQTDFQSHRPTNPVEDLEPFSTLVDSGRALVCPVYHGSNERYAGVMQMNGEEQKVYYRDAQTIWARELGRTLDYLAEREDMDIERAVYLGLSYGVAMPLPAAIMEQRFVGYALLHGGLVPWGRELQAPIADMKNFIAHLTRPVFMLSGRFDTIFPLVCQEELYKRLGMQDKTWIQRDGGHGFISDEDLLELARWLDERF